MRLNGRILKNVANVNHWEYANQAYAQEGQTNEFYLQLVNLDIVPDETVRNSLTLPDFPLRYIPQGTTVTLELTFPKLDSNENIVKTATQPFVDDKSIFKVSLTSDEVPDSGSIKGKLTIDGINQFFLINNAIVVELLEVGGC